MQFKKTPLGQLAKGGFLVKKAARKQYKCLCFLFLFF